jgi:hypothetical protein
VVDAFVLVEARTTFSEVRKTELLVKKKAAMIAAYKN